MNANDVTAALGFMPASIRAAMLKAAVAVSTGQKVFAEQTLTDAATVNIDLNANQVVSITIAGNRTIAAPTNMIAGGLYVFTVIQGIGGSHTLTWNSVFKWPGGTAPTLSTAAGAVDMILFYSNGTNMRGILSVLNIH